MSFELHTSSIRVILMRVSVQYVSDTKHVS